MHRKPQQSFLLVNAKLYFTIQNNLILTTFFRQQNKDKYLRVTLDPKLNFNYNINYIIRTTTLPKFFIRWLIEILN